MAEYNEFNPDDAEWEDENDAEWDDDNDDDDGYEDEWDNNNDDWDEDDYDVEVIYTRLLI